MHTKYFLLTVLCSWASLSSYLPSTTAHSLLRASSDDQNQEETLLEGSEGQELLASFNDNFALVPRELENTKPAAADSKKGKGKGKGNGNGNGKGKKPKPNPTPKPVVVEESEDDEEESEDEPEENEDTIVVGESDDKTDETPSTVDDDSDIKQVAIKTRDEFHHFEVQTCTMVEVPLDQGGIELTVNPLSNTQKIMLTTSELTSCSQIINFECPKNAKFCQEQDLSEGTYLKLGQEVCYHNVAYLYLLPNNAAEPLEFELKVSVTNEVECKVTEQEGPSITPDQLCQGEQCQENSPVTSTDESIEQSESGSHANILTILGITFAASLLLCLVFSCYYRYQFRHNNKELCSPPSCCPNFLFPRNSHQTEGFMSSGNKYKEQEMSGDYQPPTL